jgi:hypothetical protein
MLPTDEYDEKLRAAIKELTTVQFAVEIEVVAGTRNFILAARNSPPYKLLMECLKFDQDLYSGKIGIYFRRLMATPFEEKYANPNDVPVSVLAVALLDVGIEKMALLDVGNHNTTDKVNKWLPLRDRHNMFWLPNILEQYKP